MSVTVLNFTLCTSKAIKSLSYQLRGPGLKGQFEESVALPVGPTTSRLETGGEDEMRPQVL